MDTLGVIPSIKQFKLLENPQSFINHNIIGNNKYDGLKIIKIGQSAAKTS